MNKKFAFNLTKIELNSKTPISRIMSVNRPYRRTRRAFINGSYTTIGANWQYIEHPKYSTSPDQYIRSADLIRKDLVNLFDYVEPSDTNLKTFSFRIHELLLRACVEVEANCKAILVENGYQKNPDNFHMKHDYFKIQSSHLLSDFEVKLPIWHGTPRLWKPFSNWNTTTYKKLPWYDSYNKSKHDRLNHFSDANFENLLGAVTGLAVLISAQFGKITFESGPLFLTMGNSSRDGMDDTVLDYFRVKYPTNWAQNERYDFDWQILSANSNDPFSDYPY